MRVTLRHGGGRSESARFDWVVGCDGAHSAVRHAAGLEFAGAQYEQDFVLADVAIRWNAPRQIYFFFGKGRNAVVLPLADGLSRIIGLTGQPPPESVAGVADEPSLEEFSQLLAEVCPFVVRAAAAALAGALSPAPSRRVALSRRAPARRRRCRAHPQPGRRPGHEHRHPGRDATSAGSWRWSRAARRRALLDSYDEERRPVGQRLLQFTDRLFSLAASSNPIVIWAAQQAGARGGAARCWRRPARRKVAFRFISQLGIRYSGSSLVGDAGERAPDALVDGVNHLVDAYNHPKHHLVVFGDGAEFLRAAIARYAPLLDGVVIADDATARRRYGAHRRRLGAGAPRSIHRRARAVVRRRAARSPTSARRSGSARRSDRCDTAPPPRGWRRAARSRR